MKKKVEDILVEENISLDEIDCGADSTPERKAIAKQLYSYLQIPKHTLLEDEKLKLKNRIKKSTIEFKHKRNTRKWIAVAAVLVFALMTGTWFYEASKIPEIVSFANSLSENKNDSITRLVLNKDQEVYLTSIESEIHYDKKGEKINIGSGQKIQQKLELLKPVFNTVIVPYGKRAQITLSEGTAVWLNSGSKLVYPAIFATNKREVYLDGEAIFDVTKNPDRPFIVKSHQIDIEVVGTVFNVSAYSDDKYSNAVLQEGVIKLSHKSKAYLPTEKQTMIPGQLAVFDPDDENFRLLNVNPADYLSWRNGYYVFKSERLGNILKKLSRYYNVEIHLQNKKLFYETFSGSLDLKSKPEEVLSIIQQTTPFKFRKEDQESLIIY